MRWQFDRVSPDITNLEHDKAAATDQPVHGVDPVVDFVCPKVLQSDRLPSRFYAHRRLTRSWPGADQVGYDGAGTTDLFKAICRKRWGRERQASDNQGDAETPLS